MIQRTINYFQKSVRNKLMVALPVVIAFILLLMFTLTIISLRKQVMDQFIKHGKAHLQLLSKQIKPGVVKPDLEESLSGDNVVYVSLYDTNNRVIFQEVRDDIQLPRIIDEGRIVERDGNLLVRMIHHKKQCFLEFETPIYNGMLVVGFSLGPIRSLLVNQTITLFGIGLVTLLATIVVIAAIGHLVSNPLKKLAGEAERLTDDYDGVTPLGQSSQNDEVGILAGKINDLISRIRSYQKNVADQKIKTELDKIVREVAHDLRGPLSSLEAASQYATKINCDDDLFPDFINILELSAKRIRRIADDVLTQYKTNHHAANTVSVHAVIDELIGEYTVNNVAPHVAFYKSYHTRDLGIVIDRNRFQRAVANLVKNAIEAMGDGGRLEIRTMGGTAEELRSKVSIIGNDPWTMPLVIVAVSDSGAGMSRELLDRVMSTSGVTTKRDGNGIGVHMVRDTVMQSGGRLYCESSPGKGTTFYMVLPNAAAVLEKEGVGMSMQKTEIVVASEKPVLVIDDDPAILEQWRLILRQQGVACIPCQSYEHWRSLQMLRGSVTTAIVDYHFDNSEYDGLAVIHELKSFGFDHMYLCTAEYWKPALQRTTTDQSIPLISKPLPEVVVKTGWHTFPQQPRQFSSTHTT